MTNEQWMEESLIEYAWATNEYPSTAFRLCEIHVMGD